MTDKQKVQLEKLHKAPRTKEWRNKMSKAISGIKRSDEFKNNQRERMTGNKASDETKRKMSEIHKKNGTGKWNKGKICLEETKKKISDSCKNKNCKEEETTRWVGEKVSYSALHCWLKRKLGKAIKCVECGKEDGRVEWSNIDHKYRRNLADYQSLCCKCHSKHDKELKKELKKYEN
jgi:hypothetical protein